MIFTVLQIYSMLSVSFDSFRLCSEHKPNKDSKRHYDIIIIIDLCVSLQTNTDLPLLNMTHSHVEVIRTPMLFTFVIQQFLLLPFALELLSTSWWLEFIDFALVMSLSCTTASHYDYIISVIVRVLFQPIPPLLLLLAFYCKHFLLFLLSLDC